MNKKIKIIGGVVAVVVAVIVVPDIGSYYQQLKMLSERLPKEYETVPLFDDLKSNSQYEIQRFDSNVPEYGLITSDGTVVVTTTMLDEDHSSDILSKWYKIDKKGRCVDSLIVQNQYINSFDSYLFNIEKAYYLTWLSDGDTVKKPFIAVGKGHVLNALEVEQELDGAIYAEDAYTANPNDVMESSRKIVFLKNNKWYKMQTSSREFLPNYSDPQLPISAETIDFNSTDKQGAVALNYFHKQHWYGDSVWDISFAINGKKPEHWTGTAYFEMKLGGPILKFRREHLDLYSHGTLGWFDLRIYQPPASKYALISMDEGRKQYLIRWN